MTRQHPLAIAALLWSLLGATAISQAALSAPTDSRVTFQAAGPAGLKIEGTTPDLNVTEQGESIVISVLLTNLTTGIALRDRHMKDKYLEVQKYPSAVLTIARASLKKPAGDAINGDVAGSLTLHGQTRPVSIHYEAKGEGATLLAYGQFRVNMSDFGIPVPSYLGVAVKPEVDVTAKFRIAGS